MINEDKLVEALALTNARIDLLKEAVELIALQLEQFKKSFEGDGR